jgi:hypothetical protein
MQIQGINFRGNLFTLSMFLVTLTPHAKMLAPLLVEPRWVAPRKVLVLGQRTVGRLLNTYENRLS